MAIGAIEGPTGSSALWPSGSVLYERMTKVLSVFAERLALRREDVVQRLADGETLAEVAGSRGMSRDDAVALAASQFAWQPGRPAMDPARVQQVAATVVDSRADGPGAPAASLAAAVTSADAAARQAPAAQAPRPAPYPTPYQAPRPAAPARRPVDVDLLGSGPRALPDPPLLLDGTSEPAPPALRLPGSGAAQDPAAAGGAQEAVQAYAARAVDAARAKEAARKLEEQKDEARKDEARRQSGRAGHVPGTPPARDASAVHAEAVRAEAAQRARAEDPATRPRPARRSVRRPTAG